MDLFSELLGQKGQLCVFKLGVFVKINQLRVRDLGCFLIESWRVGHTKLLCRFFGIKERIVLLISKGDA